MVQFAQIIAAGSLPIALGLVVTSALFLDDWRGPHENCKLNIELCQKLKYFVIGAAFGIVAASLQLVATVTAIFQKWHLWCFLHVLVFIGATIAFALPMEKGADSMSWYIIKDNRKTKAKWFLAMAGIDFIYSFFAAGVIFLLGRSTSSSSNRRR